MGTMVVSGRIPHVIPHLLIVERECPIRVSGLVSQHDPLGVVKDQFFDIDDKVAPLGAYNTVAPSLDADRIICLLYTSPSPRD